MQITLLLRQDLCPMALVGYVTGLYVCLCVCINISETREGIDLNFFGAVGGGCACDNAIFAPLRM